MAQRIIESECREIVLRIAAKAAEFLLHNFKKDHQLFHQRGLAKEITTRYDKESDALISREIEKLFPDHNILAEESGHKDKHSEYTWIIDSLDGSGNYANGNPFFAVSIAIAKNNKIILGVISAPALGEVYCALKGMGATLNGRKIAVSKNKELNNSYIVACGGGEKDNRRLTTLTTNMEPLVKDFRKLGSAAIEGGFVASGRAEGYITLKISPWDIAAATLLVEEAGGVVSDFYGKEWKMEESDIVMSNGVLHPQIIRSVMLK